MLHQVQRRITSTITPATVVYLQIDNGNIANQIHGFTIDYGKFIVNIYISLLNKDDARSTYISWKFSHSKCSFASESFSSTITVKWCLECFYSRTPLTRTLKGNENLFELAGFRVIGVD